MLCNLVSSHSSVKSFLQQGFPATMLFERNGPIADPMYHNSGMRSRLRNIDFCWYLGRQAT